jgi:hypothetical protein
MRKKKWDVVLGVFLGLAMIKVAHAGKLDVGSGIVWTAGVDGVEIEWSADGSFNRVYSAYCHPVNIPDRRGIAKATTIAEEKAKAAIIRFIKQESFSNRLVTEIDSDVEQATSTQTGDSRSVSKETRRQMTETLTVLTGSTASGLLKGVVVLETGYDTKRQESCVRVGISKKTMGTAAALGESIKGGGGSSPSQPSGESSSLIQESESRKTRMKDW